MSNIQRTTLDGHYIQYTETTMFNDENMWMYAWSIYHEDEFEDNCMFIQGRAYKTWYRPEPLPKNWCAVVS